MTAFQTCPPLDDDIQEVGYNNYDNYYNYGGDSRLPLVDYYSYDDYGSGSEDIKCSYCYY